MSTLSVSPGGEPIKVNFATILVGSPPGLRLFIRCMARIRPDTAYVVCISVSLGFRHKPSDTALFSVIALATFKRIVSSSVTKGALVCFVVTVHWWRHRTHYDVIGANRALCNILIVHLNNGATRADLHNSIMEIHNTSMDLHNSIMEIHK